MCMAQVKFVFMTAAPYLSTVGGAKAYIVLLRSYVAHSSLVHETKTPAPSNSFCLCILHDFQQLGFIDSEYVCSTGRSCSSYLSPIENVNSIIKRTINNHGLLSS